MIRKLILENYRCYKYHEIDFNDISVILGKNNAGKSTLIEALRIISIITNRYKNLSFISPDPSLDFNPRLKVVTPSLKNFDFSFENISYMYSNNTPKIKVIFSNKVEIQVFIVNNDKIQALIYDASGKNVNNKLTANRTKIPNISILPQIGPLLKVEKPLDEEYVKANIFSSLASTHFRNQLQFFKQFYSDFKDYSEKTWPNLLITEFQNGDKINKNAPTLLVRDNEFVAEIGLMGDGLQMWLQTMWFIARTQKDSILILDEPDVYLHADMQRKLINFLKKLNKQIILATHSIEILAEIEPDHILLLDRKRNKSIFATKMPTIQKIVYNMGSIHNIEISKLWSSKKFLIVEGTDISILKKFHSTIFPNSQEPLSTLPKTSIGGWGGWHNVVGTKFVLKNAFDDSIQIYCILDSDYHSKAEIDSRYDEAKKSNINLHILNKKEIENYLIVPQAIHRLLKSKIFSKNITNLNLEIIRIKLNEIADTLKENVIDSFSTTFQNDNKNLTAGTATKTLANILIINGIVKSLNWLLAKKSLNY